MTMFRTGQQFRKTFRSWIPGLLALAWGAIALNSNLSPAFATENETSFRWRDVDGKELPFDSSQVEDFLARGVVVSARPITGTASRPFAVTLEADGRRMTAVFRHVDEFRHQVQNRNGFRLSFRDNALFECAAYRLDVLLCVGRVPPTVRRELSDQDFTGPELARSLPARKGSLQVWVPEVMTEGKRIKDSLLPPVGRDWAFEFQVMWLFDNLIHNDDRNRGNILIDGKWRIWLIDATRAFRPMRWLPFPDRIRLCERRIWERLQVVSDEEIRGAVGDFLMESELDCLLERRRALVGKIQQLVRSYGKKTVIFDHPGPMLVQSRIPPVRGRAETPSSGPNALFPANPSVQ